MCHHAHMDDNTVVRKAELALLTPAVRRDAATVRSMLHQDVVEIGRSGRRFNREGLIAALGQSAAQAAGGEGSFSADDWQFEQMAPDLVLVTYRIDDGGRVSRHASVWELGDGVPVLRFHQGTVVPNGE